MLPLGTIRDPEIVIGLVGRIGVDTKRIGNIVATALRRFNYKYHHVKITSLIPAVPGVPELLASPKEKYYTTRIDACNYVRKHSERNDIFAALAISRIREIRGASDEGTPDKPLERTAFIIDQLKTPEESQLLRQVYGDLFIQISCHSPRIFRQKKLSSSISKSHASDQREADWATIAATLIGRDDSEEKDPYGQKVRDVFPLADLVVDASSNVDAEKEIGRFLDLLFGDPRRSPTEAEYGLASAHSSSMRSADTARQVGAAIFSCDGDLVSTGCNEVPKPGGGVYSNEPGHARDVDLGSDQSAERKRLMVIDIVRRLAKGNRFSDPVLNDASEEKLAELLLDDRDAPLRDSLIMDSLEYGRMMHAEMHAITSAAKRGSSVKDATLYCTTFPCHNCAKHIIGAGLASVVYLQPFPKSFVDELYPDSIDVDDPDSSPSRIAFRQFLGVAPQRYATVFKKGRLKDSKGLVLDWDPRLAHPITGQVVPLQSDLETFAIKDVLEPAMDKLMRVQGPANANDASDGAHVA